jgi:hypothetical protein
VSTLVFPALIGVGFPKRTSMFKSRKQTNLSGKEVALADWQTGRDTWELGWDLLRTGTQAEFQALYAFHRMVKGGFDSWLYTDADDNAVLAQIIATGTGTTQSFPLQRTLSGLGYTSTDPVLAPNAVSAVYLNGIAMPPGGIGPPGLPSLSSIAGGSLAGTAYFVYTTFLTGAGETLPSAQNSIGPIGANQLLVVAAPSSPPPSALSWSVYVSNTAGGGGSFQTLQQAAIPLGSNWTEPTSGLVAGAAPPVVNGTGWSVTNWAAVGAGNAPGILSFNNGGGPGPGVVVTADFTYFWPCRFVADECQFEKFNATMYMVKKLAWMSIK